MKSRLQVTLIYPVLFLVFTLAFSGIGCRVQPKSNSTPWTQGVIFDHVIEVVLENTNYETALAQPYLNSLSKEGALLTNFHGLFHPSYANYLAMIGGRSFNTVFDYQKDIDAPHLGDLLEAKNLTWKNYAEGFPGNCFLGSTHGKYARKHVPFMSFTSVQRDPARCARVVDGPEFVKDLKEGTLPIFSFYSPDMENDAHDTSIDYGANWLKGFLEPILADSKLMKKTLIVITFDESATYFGNHIYTVLIGGMVKPGTQESARLNHYNVLRTIEDNFALGTLKQQDAKASPITSIWTEEATEALKAKFGAGYLEQAPVSVEETIE